MSIIRTILVLVQPGLGKTYLTEIQEKVHEKILDFDIGSMRKHFLGDVEPFGLRWSLTKKYYPALYEMLNISGDRYNIILLNEPAFFEYVYNRMNNVMRVVVVASDAGDWLKRVLSRDKESSFGELMKQNCESWYPGWVETALRTKSELIYLEPDQYLSDILDRIILVIRDKKEAS